MENILAFILLAIFVIRSISAQKQSVVNFQTGAFSWQIAVTDEKYSQLK